MFAYMHALDSKMSGMDEQSSLLLPRFWPSLQQSSMDVCSVPVDIQKTTYNVYIFVDTIYEQVKTAMSLYTDDVLGFTLRVSHP